MASPMQTQTKGNLCTKLVVPSTGSTIHVGSSVNSEVNPCAAIPFEIDSLNTWLNMAYEHRRFAYLSGAVLLPNEFVVWDSLSDA